MRLNISQIHLLVIDGSFDLFGNRKPIQALIVLCMHAKEKRKKSYPKYKPSCTPPLTPHISLQPLHDDRRRGTTAVADGSDALLTLLQSVHQGDDNSGTRGTDRVTEGDGTALDVDLGPVQTEHPFSRDAHHGKGLVEFPEGDLVLGHTGILESKGYGEGRGGGEVDGSTSGVGEAENLGKRLQAFLLHNLARSQDDGGSTVVEGGRVGSGNGPVLLDKDRSDGPKLVLQKLLVLLVLLDHDISLSALDGDGRNLIGKRVGGPRFLGAGVGRETKVVLVFTGDLELGGGVFGTVAHGELVVHVKETVDDERVLGLKVAERGCLTGDKEGSLGHALHTTGDHDTPLAKLDVLGGKHNGLHTTGTDLVDGGGICSLGDTCTDTDLPGGRLPNTSLDDVAHVKLLDALWLDTGPLDGVLDGDDTELRGGDGGEGAVLCADGGSGGGDDVHGVGHYAGLFDVVCGRRNEAEPEEEVEGVV